MYTKTKHWIVSFTVVSMLLPTSILLAAAPAGTTAIEQDWRVELYSVPDADRLTCPLWITSFSIPLVPALFQCTWNHRDVPILEEGGIQLQAYRWNDLLDDEEVLTPPWREKLSDDDEVVTWTQRLHISSLSYVFTVKNINSTTWGAIPGPYTVNRRFLIWTPPLEGYSYAAIEDNSGIVMGSNRFKILKITQTRFYDGNGVEFTGAREGEKILFSQPLDEVLDDGSLGFKYFDPDKRLGD